jgi:protein gp37
MSSNSSIEWTDATWNCVRGCSIISPGCKFCYAMKQAHRFSGPGGAYEGLTELGPNGPRWTGKVRTIPELLEVPLHWKKPRRIFVNSMSDLFHEDVPHEFIRNVYAMMHRCEWHTFQVLTKRPERMRQILTKWFPEYPSNKSGVAPNVWLGVSVENQDMLQRVDVLKDVPAAVRFISFEPLLEDLGALILDQIHWVIVGGESGPGARSFDVSWARSIVRQCRKAEVACFVKQLGTRPVEYLTPYQSLSNEKAGKLWNVVLEDRKGGNPAEWPEDLRVREFPAGVSA